MNEDPIIITPSEFPDVCRYIKDMGIPAIIAVVGLSASGKDTVVRDVINQGLARKFVSYTTRPARPGEVDGYDYYFISKNTYRHMEPTFAAKRVHNDNLFGMPNPDSYPSDIPWITIIDDQGLEGFRANVRRSAIIVVKVDASYETRYARLLKRSPDEAGKLRQRDEVDKGINDIQPMFIIDTEGE